MENDLRKNEYLCTDSTNAQVEKNFNLVQHRLMPPSSAMSTQKKKTVREDGTRWNLFI